ncbi:PEP-CTERM sorting domain-containing protein [Methylococcaceae bacterium WWC4]|nr:PEP-CTERM sorting domain-containing protein [Methylococcaceae bacterium WWC4]
MKKINKNQLKHLFFGLFFIANNLNYVNAAPYPVYESLDGKVPAKTFNFSIPFGNGYSGAFSIYAAVFDTNNGGPTDPFGLSQNTVDSNGQFIPSFSNSPGSFGSELKNIGYLYLFELGYDGPTSISNLSFSVPYSGFSGPLFQWGTFSDTYFINTSNFGDCSPDAQNPQLAHSTPCASRSPVLPNGVSGVNNLFTASILNFEFNSTTNLFGFTSINKIESNRIIFAGTADGIGDFNYEAKISVVPEPATLALFTVGLIGISFSRSLRINFSRT